MGLYLPLLLETTWTTTVGADSRAGYVAGRSFRVKVKAGGQCVLISTTAISPSGRLLLRDYRCRIAAHELVWNGQVEYALPGARFGF